MTPIARRSHLSQPPDLEALRRPCDGKESAVVRQMTGAAQEDEVPGIMAAAVDTVNHVVELEPSRRATAIGAAAAAIAAPHQARDAGRNVLVRPLGGGAIDGSDVLGIAQGALDRRRIDGDLCAGAFLPALAAAPTHGHGDLELRAARGLGRRRAVEHRAAQCGDERVIEQVPAVLVVEDRHSMGWAWPSCFERLLTVAEDPHPLHNNIPQLGYCTVSIENDYP
jgi:hypothetical protein